MASMSGPVRLTSDHRNALNKIFQYPASQNIEWYDVFSLLAAIGSVTRHRDNNVAVAVGSELRFLDVPEHTEPDVDTVVDSRYVGSVAREAFDSSGTRVFLKEVPTSSAHSL